MVDNKPEKQIPPEQILPELDTESSPVAEQTESEQSRELEPAPQRQKKETENKSPKKFRPPQIRKPLVLPTVKDEITVKVEKIMEEGLNDAYQRLSPVAKQEFKIKGEKIAIKISELLRSTHVKVKKIFRLLIEWMKMLPGVNKFFLEQEAKIKADKILQLKKRE